MKKIIVGLIFIVFVNKAAISQITIYVSNNGDDNNIGSYNFPVKTLEGAYVKINSPGSVAYFVILKNDGGNINVAKNNANGFIWSKSGSAIFPIKISSESCFTILTRASDSATPMIHLKNANYIFFTNIYFRNCTRGAFMFDNADYCNISYCKFSGITPVSPISGAVIWIGENCENKQASYGNIISNNIFFELYTTTQTNQHHAIYLSNKAYNNSIYNNTIVEPPAYSIHGWHGDYSGNNVSYNICTQKWNPDASVKAMTIGYNSGQDACINHLIYPPNSVNNNSFYNNYVYDNYNSECVTIDPNVLPYNNSQWGNIRYSNQYPSDPYWLGYSASQISNRIVSGDFNRDGKEDDIAAFYDNGNGSTNIHVWNTDPISNKALKYSGGDGWWYSASYTSDKISGRVISGDFDRDGKVDDIAVFYDYGNSTSAIHVWSSNNNFLGFSGTWWYTNGYDANKITNKVISGDFDRDGYKDDIAAFYDYGSGNIRIHVWLSTGSGFLYQGSSGWWSVTNGGYDANKITNRVISGDFDRDGYKDDIAAFYDYGNGNTRTHVWISTGSGFLYQGSSGWWSVTNGGYNASNIVGRVISGDFDRDGYTDDISAFFDNGNGSANLHVWLSTGGSFTYQYGSGWWGVSGGYDVNKITGRVVSGDFDRDGYIDDITAFYDYSSNCGALRSNVWQSNFNSFNYINNSLGYPWLTTFSYARVNNNFTNEIETTQEYKNKKSDDNVDSFSVYPVPFRTTITIKYFLSKSSIYDLSLYSLEGKKVITIHNGFQDVGEYFFTLDSRIIDIQSGVYFCVLKSEDKLEVRKIVLYKE